MYERRTITEVCTFVVKSYCDCGGEYTYNGRAQMTSPPQFVHACSDCGHTITSKYQYPMDTTQEVGEPVELPDEDSS